MLIDDLYILYNRDRIFTYDRDVQDNMIELIVNEQIHEKCIKKIVPETRRFLWIATADLKDMHVEKKGKYVPFLSVLNELAMSGVEIRLLHAKEPGPRFREDFDRYPGLIESDRFERALCPRVHFKAIISDGKRVCAGSANLTGAGMGPRSPGKRNFEMAFVSDDSEIINRVMDQFDSIFIGRECARCLIKHQCPDPIG